MKTSQQIKSIIDYNLKFNENMLVKQDKVEIDIEELSKRHWRNSEYVLNKFTSMDKDELEEYILKEYNVEVDNIDEISEEDMSKLAVSLYDMTKRRMGNIVGFLNSDKNTSYSKTKEYTRNPLKGTYDYVFTKSLIFNNLCWNISGSGQTKAAERTAFNKLVDNEAVEIASNIILHSKVNQESKSYPITGLIASIQALRFIGWNSIEIQNVSRELNLADIVYVEYNVKPRASNEARIIRNVMLNKARKLAIASNRDNIENEIAIKMNWGN